VQFWYKDTGLVLKDRGLFSKDSQGFDSGGHLTIFTDESRKIKVRLQSTDNHYYVLGANPVVLYTWYLLTFTFGPGGMRLYINDALVDDDPYTGGLIGNHEPLALGFNTWDTGDLTLEPLESKYCWSGYMDEVVIYDSVLTAQQIKDLFDFGTTCVPELATVVLLGPGSVLIAGRRR
jgi:hypothetical protein